MIDQATYERVLNRQIQIQPGQEAFFEALRNRILLRYVQRQLDSKQ